VFKTGGFMQKSKKIKIVKWIFMALLIVMFLAFVVPIPMNNVYDAIEIKLDDPNYLVKCQVKIYGKYHMNLFTDDMFDGKIVVSDYKLTNEKMSKMYFSDDGWPLEYIYVAGHDTEGRSNRDTYFLGRLYSKSWFRQMSIIVFSDNPVNKNEGGKAEGSWGDWNENDGYCIVPLANTREEALNILTKNELIRSNP